MPHSAANLQGSTNKPYVQDAVIELLARADQPLLLREVAMECQVPISSGNRVLWRLSKKRQVTRYKLPVQGHPHRYGHKACLLCTATQMLYVYSRAAIEPT